MAPGTWWEEPVQPLERAWVVIATVIAVVFFSAAMLVWHVFGQQNVVGRAYRVDPKAYQAEVERFVQQHKVGEEAGQPVVAPPPGADVYMLAQRFRFYPILKLKAGERYVLHVASIDYLHGFSITQPHVWNLQLYPGYEWVLAIVPRKPGTYHMACNEFCGVGHEMMLGKIVVER